MKKLALMKVAAAAVAALTMGSSFSEAAVILANPGFETPQATPSGELAGAAGWSTYGGVYTENVTGRADLQAHEGTQVVKTFGNGGLYQNFAVVPGQSYSATSWAEFSASDAPPTAAGSYIGGQLLVIFHNAGGGQVGATLSSTMVALDGNNDRDVYHKGSLSGLVPATATQLTFQLNQYAGGGGAVFFDDNALTLGVTPEPASLSALAAGGLLMARRRRA